ncbi:MAG: hypothetical protein IJD73_04920 [Clostridia bacterium]|nr:hypothetical protein [Clostridia bacterium]
MRKQNMAGRIALAIATVLLCAVFVTTSVLSTTFAKYTTTGEVDSETARVAKWGIELSNRSNAATSWSVVEDETSITAASSGTTGDNVIAPGTSGYLACFKVTGNPEVAHDVTVNFDVTIGDGYKNLIGQDSYFPILITVGRASYDDSDAIIDRNELHYYVPKSDIGSLENLISSVDSKTFTEHIAPNGWSDSAYAEYYVRWDWFYNADDVPSYIPDDVKTALTAYQNSGDDTLLSEAMVLQFGKEEVKGSITTLNSALTTAKSKLSGTPATADVTNLENALAAYLGVGARSYSIGDNVVTKTYNVRWSDLNNQGAMEIYDNNHTATNYKSYFNVGATTARIYSTRKSWTNRDLCYFTTLNSSLPLTSSTYYEMTFNAANYVDTQYAGVVVAAKATETINDKKWRKPYFFYGGLGGVSQINDTYTNTNYACIEIDYCTYGDDVVARTHKNVAFTTIADTGISATAKKYGQYKVIYNGLKLTFQYKNTSGTYSDIGSYTVASGTTLAVGLESRNDDGTSSSPANKHRTMILRDVVITQKIDATAKSVLQGLVDEVQSIVDAHSTDRDFTISANATIAITQTKSEPNP